MKKSITAPVVRKDYRLQLLSTVSAFALIGAACGAIKAQAAESNADRPPLWIELGWQFERVGGSQEPFLPSFVSAFAANGFSSPLKVENALPWSYGADGKISFEPQGSDWTFSASVRYGRAHGRKSIHQETAGPGQIHIYLGTHLLFTAPLTPGHLRFAQTEASNSENHLVLDFQAGKDVGLGLFGHDSTSQLGAGIRFAQFQSKSHPRINAGPDYVFPTNAKYPIHFHTYSAKDDETREFHGVGPSLSWNASTSLAGNLQDGEMALDWGANVALLFGRQKTSGKHQTSSLYSKKGLFSGKYYHRSQPPAVYHDRSKSVAVPNIGGFVGASVQWTNAKVSVGYRADVFLNAIDGGIDTRKTVNRGFYGPFASISVGLGD